mgnify:CR=1 FL=1
MNKKIYIANWKMNMSVKESEAFLADFLLLYKELDNRGKANKARKMMILYISDIILRS